MTTHYELEEYLEELRDKHRVETKEMRELLSWVREHWYRIQHCHDLKCKICPETKVIRKRLEKVLKT